MSKTKLTDIESEKTILSGMLKQTEKIDKTLLEVEEKYFTNKLYKNLFKIITKVYVKHGSLVTHDLVSSFLESNGIPQEIRLKYLVELDELRTVNPNDAEFAFGVNALKKAYLSRFMTDILTQTTHALEAKGGSSAFKILDKKLYELKSDFMYKDSMSITDMRNVDPFLDYLKDIRENPEKHQGIKSGWQVLDSLTAGFRQGEYILIIAKSGSGKSMALLNWANYASNLGYNAVYVSIEMPKETIQERILSLESGIPFLNIKTQNLTIEQLQKQEDVLRKVIAQKKGSLYIHDVPKCTVGLIEAQLRQINQNTPIDIVFVDYLGLLKPEVHVKSNADWAVASAISNDLRDLARSMKLPVVTAHQVTTEGMKKTPQADLELEDIAVSRRIADPADLVIGLIWDKLNPNFMKLCVPKCRGGRLENARLWCDLNVCLIKDVPEDMNNMFEPPSGEEVKDL